MSKYQFTIEDRVGLVTRMYQDHGYDIDEIILRLRYPKDFVEEVIEKFKVKHGKKSWRY